MTTVALTIVTLAFVLAVAEHRRNRRRQRWLDERERLEAYGEHIAQVNGHPHTVAVLHVVPGDDDGTP